MKAATPLIGVLKDSKF